MRSSVSKRTHQDWDCAPISTPHNKHYNVNNTAGSTQLKDGPFKNEQQPRATTSSSARYTISGEFSEISGSAGPSLSSASFSHLTGRSGTEK